MLQYSYVKGDTTEAQGIGYLCCWRGQENFIRELIYGFRGSRKRIFQVKGIVNHGDVRKHGIYYGNHNRFLRLEELTME